MENIDAKYVFDAFASRYDKWYDKPFGKTAFALERECMKLLCKGLEKPFLEVGVGTGRFAISLNIEYGVDISLEVLKFAKKRRITVVRGKGEDLPFANGSFGAVFIIVTLCFVDDPLKTLREARRVLNDGGFVILGLILKESPWARFYEKKGEEGNIFYKIAKFYNINEVKSMLKYAGFQITEMVSTIFQPPTEKPLNLEPPKKGYCEEAGFVAIKTRKANYYV